MIKKLQCKDCGQAEYGEDLYNYDNKILCRYCIVSRVCESSTPCEYVGTCNDKTFPNKAEQIDQLKQQLDEKQNMIDEINKEFVQAVHDWKTLCAEKDKEIEDCKRNELYEENMKILAVKNKTQLAIKELEKVKEWCKCSTNVSVDLCDEISSLIDQQIKELKGEKDVKD